MYVGIYTKEWRRKWKPQGCGGTGFTNWFLQGLGGYESQRFRHRQMENQMESKLKNGMETGGLQVYIAICRG